MDFLKKEIGHLPIWAWGLVGIGGAGLGLYFVKRNQGTTAAPASGIPVGTQSSDVSQGTVQADTSAPTVAGNSPFGQGDPFQSVPTGNGNGAIPVVPYGVSPIYDSNGNLVGWQQPGPPPTHTVPPPPPPGTGVSSSNPLIPYGKLPPGTKYSTSADLKAHPTLNYGGVAYWLVPGPNGKLYGVAGAHSDSEARMSNKQVLLYEPQSFYH